MTAEQFGRSGGPYITYTLFPDVTPTKRTERADVPWGELVERIKTAATYLTKKHCPLISLAAYGELLSDKNCIRHADNVLRIHGVEIDYDGEEVTPEEGARRLQAAALKAVVYTSPSHVDGAPRWRALLPLSEVALPDQRAFFVGRANRALGGIATRESFTLSQSFYIGRVRGAAYRVIETDGRTVDLAADIEPLYYTGHGNGQSPIDVRTDAQLRESFTNGNDRYQAMLKLSARWAARGMSADDIMAALHGLLEQGNPRNADGVDLRTRVEPMARSAVAKYGESRQPRREIDWRPMSDVDPGEPPPVELPPLEVYAEEIGGPPGATSTEPPPAKPARDPIDWESLEGREPPARVWRIDHWMGIGPTLLAGAGGIGKSLLAQTMATALALGRHYVDQVATPQTVLMWSCEDDRDEIWRRQVAICRYFDVPLSALKGRLVIEPRLGKSNALFGLAFGQPAWTALREELVEQVNDYRATVLFLDNIGQVFGGSENDRHHVTTFVNGICGMTAWPLSTVLLGHPAKAAGSEFSGSTAWENAVRMRWFLGTTLPDQPEAATAEDGIRYLAKRKTNYSVHDWRRLSYADGTLAPEAPLYSAGGYAAQSRNEHARRLVLIGLERLAAMSIPTTHAANSPGHLPRKLIEMGMGEDYTKAELSRAMNDLLVAGSIEVGVVGRYDKGGKRTGLKVTGKDTPE